MDEEIVRIALDLKCGQATLVPEKRQEVTTEGGLDVTAHAARTAEVTKALKDAGVVVSAFIDPVPLQVQAARDAGCDAVEIHTGTYANACLLGCGPQAEQKKRAALDDIRTGLEAALAAGLIVHAGHGLTYTNVAPVAAMEGFTEFNIGHSIISRALFVGLRQAVAEMKRLIA